jgi:hypothetical protein
VAVIAVTSGKAAPGATTAVCALASVWPRGVLVADCDPGGGDVLVGWLSPWLAEGWLRAEVGVLSFATASRYAAGGTGEQLGLHTQHVYPARGVWLLAGVRDAAQAASVTEPGWGRLAEALAEVGGEGEVDVLVDVGRLGAGTPWPVLGCADAVVVAVRGSIRGVAAARTALRALDGRVDTARVGLLGCATRLDQARQAARALDRPLLAELPDQPAAAAVFSDGAPAPRGLGRSLLVRAARATADRLLTRALDGQPSGAATGTGGSR